MLFFILLWLKGIKRMYDFYLSANFRGEKIGLEGFLVYVFCEVAKKEPFIAISKDNKNFKEFKLTQKNITKALKQWIDKNYDLLLKLWKFEITHDEFIKKAIK